MARIRAAPADDEPRLVLADWLQQQGDPYGELVAVQCALAQRGDGDESDALVRRERALWGAHGARWCAELGASRRALGFARGLAREVAFAASGGRIGLDALPALAEHPIEELVVELPSATPLDGADLDRLRGWIDERPPRLLRIHRMTLEQSQREGAADETMEALLSSPGLAGVREVDLALLAARNVASPLLTLLANRSLEALDAIAFSCHGTDPRPLAALLSIPACRGLRTLSIGSGHLAPDMPLLDILSAAPPSTRELRLVGTDPGLVERWPEALGGLESLSWDAPFSPSQLGALLRAGSRLSALDLGSLPAGEALAELAPALAGPLRRLRLRTLEPDGLRALAALDLGPLEAVDVDTYRLRRDLPLFLALVDALARGRNRPLRTLRLSRNGPPPGGIEALARAGLLDEVETLAVTQLDADAVAAIEQHARRLRHLEIGTCSIEAARALAEAPLARRLRTLALDRIAQGVGAVLADAPFERLARLRSNGTSAPDDRAALQRAPWFAALDRARFLLYGEVS